MKRPLVYLMALAALAGPTPAERLVRINNERRRSTPDNFVEPILSRDAQPMNPAELARYSRKRQRQRQTHRGKRGKR